MNIALFGKEFQPSYIIYVQQLVDLLRNRGASLWVYEPFYQFISRHLTVEDTVYTYRTTADLPEKTDFMLSLGGDGTMLAAVSVIGDSGIPVTGINLGRLGFLASINKDDIETAVNRIAGGDFMIQRRALLKVTAEGKALFGGMNVALNDITLLKLDTSSMITVNAYLNKELLNSYWSDGLIVATPTGSTAYSLSCGGPIVIPGSGNFVITPISPHNLNVRPIVVSEPFELEIAIESRNDRFLLSCDSRTEEVDTGTSLRITQAPYKINLIRLKEESFLSTLREKLLWGLDTRNY